MNTLYGIATLFVAFAVSSTRAGPHGPPMCNGKEIKLPEDAEATMKTCSEKIFAGAKPDPKDSKKFLCMMVCQAQQLGLVNDAGKVLEDKVTSFFQGALPKEAADVFIPKLKECMKTSGDKVTISETDCSDSDKLFDCGRQALQDTCK